ncbi:MAG TPA: 4Fe-4S binding protein, partial [Vicinamibacterales bacterium]|nr:4Fe-4S binding protein [Vicinamibacterales bacterium]
LETRAEANGLPLTALIKDDDRCIRCGLCAIRCPTEAMTMERFTITERWASPGPPVGAAAHTRADGSAQP